MKNRKRLLPLLLLLAACLTVLSLPVFADIAPDAIPVPGGTVTNVSELSDALGGHLFIKDEDELILNRDVILTSPLIISGGEWKLDGAGCKIIRGFEKGNLIECKDGATVTLGREDKDGDDTSLMLVGGVKTTVESNGRLTPAMNQEGAELNPKEIEGALLYVHKRASVTLYYGIEIRDGFSLLPGGGVVCDGGAVTNMGAVISGCASEVEGGNVYVTGAGSYDFGSGTLLGGAAGQRGGNLSIAEQGRVTMVDGLITDGYAKMGGGIYANGTLTMSGGSIVACGAEMGGGIYYAADNHLVLGNFQNNVAQKGGGIYNAAKDLKIDNVVSSHNQASHGGGLYNSGSVTIKTCNMTDSECDIGGGIYNSAGGTLTIQSGTVGMNKATYGGGVFNAGVLHAFGISISANRGELGEGLFNEGAIYIYKGFYCSERNNTFLVLSEGGKGSITLMEHYPSKQAPMLIPGKKTPNGYEIDYGTQKPLLTGDDAFVEAAAKNFKVEKQGIVEYGVSADGMLEMRFGWLVPFVLGGAAIVLITATVLILLKKRKAR